MLNAWYTQVTSLDLGSLQMVHPCDKSRFSLAGRDFPILLNSSERDMDGRRQKSEVRSQKSEVRSQKPEAPCWGDLRNHMRMVTLICWTS